MDQVKLSDAKAVLDRGAIPIAAAGVVDAQANRQVGHMSLEGMHGSVEVPHHEAAFWKQWRAYVGPALLISIGYMDPGNWGTDLQSGAQYKYGLLWVPPA